MFSFHKPKIYRSVNGCCICKAKSSSSRFTDSKKYEPEFERCFLIKHRSGEICNACVLLVKRWKKLPPGTTRHWHHVVDARAGPGTKATMKCKSKTIVKKPNRLERVVKSGRENPSYHYRPYHTASPDGLSDDICGVDDCCSDNSFERSVPSSLAPSPSMSTNGSDIEDDMDDEDDDEIQSRRAERKHRHNSRARSRLRGKTDTCDDDDDLIISSFLDMTYWKKARVCCGIIFKGPNGEVLIDSRLLKPCYTCKTSKSPSTVSTEPSSSASLPESSSPSHSTSVPALIPPSTISSPSYRTVSLMAASSPAVVCNVQSHTPEEAEEAEKTIARPLVPQQPATVNKPKEEHTFYKKRMMMLAMMAQPELEKLNAMPETPTILPTTSIATNVIPWRTPSGSGKENKLHSLENGNKEEERKYDVSDEMDDVKREGLMGRLQANRSNVIY